MVTARSVLRAVFAVCVLLSAGVVVGGYATYSPADDGSSRGGEGGRDAASGREETNGSTPQGTASGVTVVTTDSNRLLLGFGNGSRAEAEIVAFDRNGSVRYYNDTYDRYWDVDPVVGNSTGSMTVEYTASDRLGASACDLDDEGDRGTEEGGDENDENANEEGVCARNVIERVNLSTGTVTPIYDEVAPRADFAPWNDVDRINDTHYVVADRTENRVFVVDVRTGEYTWEWYAASAFPFDSGGRYVDDWTHVNDVERLDDGRIMVSLRNHDQVVFLDPARPPERAVVPGWTLGADGDHTVLYEQYNPDYIARENGGPAIVVADAENNRVVEYARRNGTWNRTWEWTDDALQWPRDADRLPNGHTLVVDSNGDRVVEVDGAGEIVWNVSVGLPYDAERLSSGPESADGPSVDRIAARTDGTNGENATVDESGRGDPLAGPAKRLLSGPALSAVLFLSPAWMGVTELVALATLLVVSACWFLLEAHWRSVFTDLRMWAEQVDR